MLGREGVMVMLGPRHADRERYAANLRDSTCRRGTAPGPKQREQRGLYWVKILACARDAKCPYSDPPVITDMAGSPVGVPPS